MAKKLVNAPSLKTPRVPVVYGYGLFILTIKIYIAM